MVPRVPLATPKLRDYLRCGRYRFVNLGTRLMAFGPCWNSESAPNAKSTLTGLKLKLTATGTPRYGLPIQQFDLLHLKKYNSFYV